MGLRDLALESVAPVVGVGVAGAGVSTFPWKVNAQLVPLFVPVKKPDVFVVVIGFLYTGWAVSVVYLSEGYRVIGEEQYRGSQKR